MSSSAPYLPLPSSLLSSPASATQSSSNPQWQDLILARLRIRDTRESAYAGVIEQYRRLAEQTRVLRERNQTLLRAMNTARASGSSGDDNAVRTALITSLESQISRMRDELSEAYKKHGQNAQRLLEMSDTQRLAEDSARSATEELRRTREELARAQRELEASRLNVREKERFIQELSDDNNALSLELTQTAARNDNLKRDNASLLQRWLDAKNDEASRMNEANGFWEEMQTARTRVASPPLPGANGEGLQSPAEISESAAGGSVGLGAALPGFRRPPASPGMTKRSPTGKENG